MRAKFTFLSALSAALLAGSAAVAQRADELQIVNIRIGQGDATLITGPANAQGKSVNVLFDSGDSFAGTDADYQGGSIISAVLRDRGIKHLDYVVISHYDADHIGGLVNLKSKVNASFLVGANAVPGDEGDDDANGKSDWEDTDPQKAYPLEYGKDDDITVGAFVDRGDERSDAKISDQYTQYKALASESGNRVSLDTQAKLDGFSINLGEHATMTPYASAGRIRGGQGKVALVTTENEHSISMLVSYKKFDFLVSGDLIGRKPKPSSKEDALIERAVGAKIQSEGRTVDVLHVNHHGADNASDAVFLEQIKPTIAVISHGNVENYKHPSVETLKRLEGAKVYRIIQTKWGTTDVALSNTAVKNIQAIYQGDVIITSDGEKYTVSTSRTFTADKNPRRP